MPTAHELAARVAADRVPVNIRRVLSSLVTGVATLGFGSLTIGTVALLFHGGVTSWLGLLGASLVVAVFGSFTVGFGSLTWSWARSLPPGKSMALTEREREELGD